MQFRNRWETGLSGDGDWESRWWHRVGQLVNKLRPTLAKQSDKLTLLLNDMISDKWWIPSQQQQTGTVPTKLWTRPPNSSPPSCPGEPTEARNHQKANRAEADFFPEWSSRETRCCSQMARHQMDQSTSSTTASDRAKIRQLDASRQTSKKIWQWLPRSYVGWGDFWVLFWPWLPSKVINSKLSQWHPIETIANRSTPMEDNGVENRHEQEQKIKRR